ncbi:hypothetical protein GF380_02370 [Candidatus Uhrbacteria bacterium]|nr:hypothetical protein [Candidatus Uhrbacteria bacterium]
MYYTTNELIENHNIQTSTLYFWADRLRDTHMVKKIGGRLLLHSDFLHFVRQRMDSSGVPSLPEPGRIGALYLLYGNWGDVDVVADRLGVPVQIVKEQMKELNLGQE